MCNLFKTVFSFLVLQKDNGLSGSFGRTSWNLLDTKPVSSYSFCQIWYTHLAFKGFRAKKGEIGCHFFVKRMNEETEELKKT